jgi:hypothetical protein
MKIKNPNNKADIALNHTINQAYEEFKKLITELNNKPLNEQVVQFINNCVDEINLSTLPETKFIKFVLEKQAAIVKQLEKEHKIVCKNHYRNTWGLLGITIFGIPIGVIIGFSNNNMGLLGLGFPLGIFIGSIIGNRLDKKAFKEGRQISTNIRNFI